ncbi:MAG: M23 family metallopeptidase [Myxococcota bacterium]
MKRREPDPVFGVGVPPPRWRPRLGPTVTFFMAAAFTYGLVARVAPTVGSPVPERLVDARLGPEPPWDLARALAPVELAKIEPGIADEPPLQGPIPGPESGSTVIVSEPAPRPAPFDRDARVVTGRIEKGETLGLALQERGVDPVLIDRVARGIRPVFNLRYIRPGDSFALVRDGEGEIVSFELQRGRRDLYRLRVGEDDELFASHEEVPLERRVVRMSGTIQSSLFETIVALGEGPDLVNDFADVFAWDIDFSRQTKSGDEFRVVFEKFYDRDGFVRYGKLLAGQYQSGSYITEALYFEDDDGYGSYYRENGVSVQRTFLRAPLKYSRISSRYSKSRLHPILKVRRPHEGVDYVAPAGTPVWAVADGVVIFRGWSGGFGRLVKVRHALGYISYYGHLSRYPEGLKKGARVRQKQVVGYVGSSGLATAAHLDYRLRLNGRFVDPLRVKLPTGKPVEVQNEERFGAVRDVMIRELALARAPSLSAKVAP